MSRVKDTWVWLSQLDEAVEIGGFRQWLEEGHGKRAQPILSVVSLGKSFVPLPKSIKVIERVLTEVVNQKLNEVKSLSHDAVSCDVCGGRAHLDDDHSGCPVCDGEGLVWSGPLVKHEKWLSAASDAYLRLPFLQRQTERRVWCLDIEKKTL